MRDIDMYAYSCYIKGNEDNARTCYGMSHGQAKRAYFDHVRDVCPDLEYTDIRARKIDAPWTDAAFRRVANSRCIPFAQIGQQVKVYGEIGIITGVNDSANLDVMMLEGKRKGMVGSYHPYDDLIICVQDEKLDLEYPPMCRNFYAKQHNGE